MERDNMTDKEILNLILEKVSNLESDMKMVNNQLDKMDSRFDAIELKQDRTSKKLDDLQLDVKIAERDIRRDIHSLNDQMETVIEVLKQHELIPQ